eukprot:TRINITY_DN9966_c0_g1_i1.p1 TRINITY_DN9966_c0_g1~~TRINITY_DN9966_c0_g1_i1.p1  ORF type:complete len:303 (-),score=17.59 TRINITY_DN9966_c0_g1_i1:1101-1874(-)
MMQTKVSPSFSFCTVRPISAVQTRISFSHAQKKFQVKREVASSSEYVDQQQQPQQTEDVYQLESTARQSLINAAKSMRNLGWVSFWCQLALSLVSAVILLFSVGFTTAKGPQAALYCAVFGVAAGFLSTFWSFGYTRLSRRMFGYANAKQGQEVKKIKKTDVQKSIKQGSVINMFGMGSTLLGVQAVVGTLVAKTLTSSSINPYLQGAAGNVSPVLAIDVFLVQAMVNTLLCHFLAMCFNTWLTMAVTSQQQAQPAS